MKKGEPSVFKTLRLPKKLLERVKEACQNELLKFNTLVVNLLELFLADPAGVRKQISDMLKKKGGE